MMICLRLFTLTHLGNLNRHGDNSVVWKGFTATVVIIAFFVLDRTMAALGHGHSHGDRHDEEEGSTSDETRTTRESTPDMKSSLDIKPMLKDSKIPKLSVSSEVLDQRMNVG